MTPFLLPYKKADTIREISVGFLRINEYQLVPFRRFSPLTYSEFSTAPIPRQKLLK